MYKGTRNIRRVYISVGRYMYVYTNIAHKLHAGNNSIILEILLLHRLRYKIINDIVCHNENLLK